VPATTPRRRWACHQPDSAHWPGPVQPSLARRPFSISGLQDLAEAPVQLEPASSRSAGAGQGLGLALAA